MIARGPGRQRRRRPDPLHRPSTCRPDVPTRSVVRRREGLPGRGGRPQGRETPSSRSPGTRSPPRTLPQEHRRRRTAGRSGSRRPERRSVVTIGPLRARQRPGHLPHRHPDQGEDRARLLAAHAPPGSRRDLTWLLTSGTFTGIATSSTARARTRSRAPSASSRDTAQAYRHRSSDYFFVLGYISLALALLNLLPILPARRRAHRDVDPRARSRPRLLAARLPPLQRDRHRRSSSSSSTSGSETICGGS